MASFGGQAKPVVNVADTNSLMQQGLNSNLSMDPQVIAAMQQYGPQYGASVLAANQNSNPTLKNLADLINSNLSQASSGVPTALSQYSQNAFRQAQGARGFGDSPMSSLAEAQTMGGVYNQFNQNSANEALQFGQLPGMQTSGAQLQEGLGLTMPTISDAYNAQFQGQGYQNNINAYLANQANARSNQTNSQIGSLIGGIGGMLPGNIGQAASAIGGSVGAGMNSGGVNLANLLPGATGATTQDSKDSAVQSNINNQVAANAQNPNGNNYQKITSLF